MSPTQNLSQRHPIDALTNIRLDEQSACWLVSTAALGIAKDFGLMPTSWQQANISKHTFLKTALLRTRPDALLTVDISNPHALRQWHPHCLFFNAKRPAPRQSSAEPSSAE